jgi:hypothetical protein
MCCRNRRLSESVWEQLLGVDKLALDFLRRYPFSLIAVFKVKLLVSNMVQQQAQHNTVYSSTVF